MHLLALQQLLSKLLGSRDLIWQYVESTLRIDLSTALQGTNDTLATAPLCRFLPSQHNTSLLRLGRVSN